MLADFCGSRSVRFDRGRWFDYILREEVTPEPPEAEPDGTEGWRVPEPEPPERPDPLRAANGRWGQPETAEPPAEAGCAICHGTRGGVLGHENVVNGVVMCDYCYVDRLAAAAPEPTEPETPATEVTWLGTTPEEHPRWGEPPEPDTTEAHTNDIRFGGTLDETGE